MVSRVKTFEANEEALDLYNGQAILNFAIYYYFDDEDDTAYTFPGYSSSYMLVYDSPERNNLIKSYTTQVTRNSNIQVLNLSESDCTFGDQGTYYYELGYIISGGYEHVLRYGELNVI